MAASLEKHDASIVLRPKAIRCYSPDANQCGSTDVAYKENPGAACPSASQLQHVVLERMKALLSLGQTDIGAR